MASTREGAGDGREAEDNRPPWPEWSDAALAATRWGAEGGEPFEDPAGAAWLPDGLAAAGWERAGRAFGWALRPDGAPRATGADPPASRTTRLIAAAALCLEREARLRPFPVERQSALFRAPTGAWHPWHHVHGPPGARDGLNPHGKYAVRLFFLGKWRCVLVDDRLPLDGRGRPLLPASEPLNLWLPLLAKALLRVAALARDPADDFSPVHCLTGWTPVAFPAAVCGEQRIWRVCCQLFGSTAEVTAALGSCPPDPEPDHGPDPDLPAVGSRAVFALVLDPPELRSRGTVPASGSESLALVSEVRYDGRPPSPLWKEYRWNRWARERGIAPGAEARPVRGVRVFEPFAASPDDAGWMDFSVFVKFVRSVEVFYKPSYFKYSLNAWSVSDLLLKPDCAEDVVRRGKGSEEKGDKGGQSRKASRSKNSPSPDKQDPAAKSRKGSKGGGKRKKGLQRKDSPSSVDEWTAQLDQKPYFFYLLIDSLVRKQLYVCLSGYDTTPPAYAQIFVGKFIWHSSSVAPIVFMLSTFGTKGFALTLGPGLHVFRIWHHMPRHFCLQIYSNTPFSTGSKMKIHQILTADSLSFQHYGSAISQRFCAMLDTAAGGGEHGQAYDRMMEALHPPWLADTLVWPDSHKARKEIEQAFEESLTEMLVDTTKLPEEFLHAIDACRVLFLNPKFGEMALKLVNREYHDFIQNRRLSFLQKETLVEAQRRGAAAEEAGAKKERSPKSKKGKTPKSPPKSPRSPKAKSAKSISETGKGASTKTTMRGSMKCKEKSLLIGDPNSAIVLMKRMMCKIPRLRRHYPFGQEDDYRLHYRDYSGTASVTDGWVVLVRAVLNLHSVAEAPCSLHAWSPAKKLVLRLVDNDAGRDVPFGFVENSVAFLARNRGGYTLCVYGRSAAPAEPWRLRVMGASPDGVLHACDGACSPERPPPPPPDQRQLSVRGRYVPNRENVVARCRLEVFADVTALLGLHLSCPEALCRLVLREMGSDVVLDTTGMGHIVVPVLHLQGPKASPEEVKVSPQTAEGVPASERREGRAYVVEVQVLKDSWPLTEEEIKAMVYYKEHLPDIYYRDKADRSPASRRSSKETIASTAADESEAEWYESAKKPTWIFSAVVDRDKEDSVALTPDLSAFEALQVLRRQWEREGVDLSGCKELRKAFLDEFTDRDAALNEDDAFHLTAKRTARLVELYGRNDLRRTNASSSSQSSIRSSRSEVLSFTDSHSHPQSPKTPSISNPSDSSARESTATSGVGTSETAELKFDSRSSEAEERREARGLMSETARESPEDHGRAADTVGRFQEVKGHLDMPARQAAIHKALEEHRTRNLEMLKEAYDETLALRTQVLDRARIAKGEAENVKKSKKSSTKSTELRKSHTSKKKRKIKV